MSAGFWENYRLADGSLDLVAALHAKRRMNTDSVRYRRAVHFLCDCEDLQPLTNPDAATIALVHALRLAYGD